MAPRLAAGIALLLAGCTSPYERRLERAWLDFEERRGACLAHADAVVPDTAEEARAWDEESLRQIVTPDGSPIARVLSISTYASLAYLNADAAGVERACAELERCELALVELEARAERSSGETAR